MMNACYSPQICGLMNISFTGVLLLLVYQFVLCIRFIGCLYSKGQYRILQFHGDQTSACVVNVQQTPCQLPFNSVAARM